MEFGPREVLIVLGALLVCGIVLDGVRRMRAARRGLLRGPRRQPIFDDEGPAEDPLVSSELPSGGARVVAYRDEDAAAELSEQLRRSADSAQRKRTAPFRERRFSEPGPVDDAEPEADTSDQQERKEPVLRATPAADLDTPPPIEAEPVPEPEPEPEPEPVPGAATGAECPDNAPQEQPLRAERIAEDDLPLFKGEPAPPPVPPRRGDRKRGRTVNGGGRPAGRGEESIEALVLHLMAPAGDSFTAKPLFEALQAAGLEFGERHIFHRVSRSGELTTPSFSVANAVKPGTFEGAVRDFQTPGVAFFMVIGEQAEPLAAFDDMLATARQVATALGAELCDEHRSTLTRQVIADYRQRILDHGRRRVRPD